MNIFRKLYNIIVSLTNSSNPKEEQKPQPETPKTEPDKKIKVYSEQDMDDIVSILAEAENKIKKTITNQFDETIPMSKGDKFLTIGDLDTAIFYYNESIKIKPTLTCLMKKAYIFIHSTRYEEAVKCSEEMLEIDENFWPAFNNIGICHLRTGKLKEARRYFELSYVECDVQLQQSVILCNIGLTYEFEKDYIHAFKFYSDAYKINNTDEVIFNHYKKMSALLN